MYLVALTTSDVISGTTYVYLHHNDRRMQLSPTIDSGVLLPTLDDARRAMALAEDFWDEVSHGVYITITGPDGPAQSHYRGVNDDHVKAGIIARHNSALAGYDVPAGTILAGVKGHPVTPLERAFHYAQFLELAAELEGRTPDPLPTHSAWGTPVHLIDGDEYCLSCERDNREGHYENCLISPPRATL